MNALLESRLFNNTFIYCTEQYTEYILFETRTLYIIELLSKNEKVVTTVSVCSQLGQICRVSKIGLSSFSQSLGLLTDSHKYALMYLFCVSDCYMYLDCQIAKVHIDRKNTFVEEANLPKIFQNVGKAFFTKNLVKTGTNSSTLFNHILGFYIFHRIWLGWGLSTIYAG